MITSAQLQTIHVLLNKQGLKDQKDSIVETFTNGRTISSREMMKDEAAALIGHLKSLEPTEKGALKMRNKILSMAHEMRWTKPSGSGVHIVDMDHVNSWCKSRGYLKKPLDQYLYAELPKLVSQFEAVYKDFLKGV